MTNLDRNMAKAIILVGRLEFIQQTWVGGFFKNVLEAYFNITRFVALSGMTSPVVCPLTNTVRTHQSNVYTQSGKKAPGNKVWTPKVHRHQEFFYICVLYYIFLFV